MWTCPKCERRFKSTNQSHMCSDRTIDDILEGRPDHVVLAFDKLLVSVIEWEPCSVGAATKAIVFTKGKAWMIVRPLTRQLDVKFYSPIKMAHYLIEKTSEYRGTYAYHVRVSHPEEVNDELLTLLRRSFDAN